MRRITRRVRARPHFRYSRLHPLWVLFALLAGGVLLGFVGVVIAVPVSAVIGVLARFALSRYKESAFYRGKDASGVG